MKRIFISALALLGMGVMANAQEKVTIHNGSESYVTNVEYITFDATDADDAVSVSALQTEITTLTGEKTTLEGQVSTLTSEKAELATAKTTLEGQVSTLTSEKAELATAKTTLEGQVSTLTSEKAELEADLTRYKEKYLKLATNGHDYVDLGLTSGTLWATCNVGADAPESYGDYYAWGEVTTHYSAGGNTDSPTWKEGYSAGYDWSTYFDTNDGGCTFIKYNNNGGKTELEDADDVAVQTWGGAWKMPTWAQQDELRNECDWEWTSINGVNGYKVKSRVNSNFIFLPAAGYRGPGGLSNAGSRGYYWSRSLGTYGSDYAYELDFLSGNVNASGNYRGYGFSVRPVCPGTK